MELTARNVLQFETQWWRQAGAKETAIRDAFGCTAIVYYQRVVQIVTAPPLEVAVEFGPTIRMLRRRMAVRDQQTRPVAS